MTFGESSTNPCLMRNASPWIHRFWLPKMRVTNLFGLFIEQVKPNSVHSLSQQVGVASNRARYPRKPLISDERVGVKRFCFWRRPAFRGLLFFVWVIGIGVAFSERFHWQQLSRLKESYLCFSKLRSLRWSSEMLLSRDSAFSGGMIWSKSDFEPDSFGGGEDGLLFGDLSDDVVVEDSEEDVEICVISSCLKDSLFALSGLCERRELSLRIANAKMKKNTV